MVYPGNNNCEATLPITEFFGEHKMQCGNTQTKLVGREEEKEAATPSFLSGGEGR